MTHDAVAELIGAWALDACPPDETELVEEHLASCDTCAVEAAALREAAADLGGAYLRPPAHSLSRLLAAAPAKSPYGTQVAALDLLLSDLTPVQWQRPALGELTVRELVAHLAATDSLVAHALGLPTAPPMPAPPPSPAARTEAVLRFEENRSPSQTHRAWRSQADEIAKASTSAGAVMVKLSRTFPLEDALTARAYETWIHREDIASATGRPPMPPLPTHIHPMADLAARVLPRVVSRAVASSEAVRLHLTGPGGGTWTVPLDPASAMTSPATAITVNVVDFCRLAANRQAPSQLAITIEGDIPLAHAFLAAVPSMAPVP
ncbi:maleylpyruvate isomerase family mycothiol-dependent enzyme [Paractinoplanes atraurantiacus]|uniref:TIGR03083 family protein n=1 Tax=Paractinoplanes atraurantiacus TaxID=1036182 RepID=A0A285HNT6_9ACTN|nr:maleylpyruvate isomerase family mycothiol-dependent enzyme [Actinoplanes atraurantiacus]SNY37400.1 TIGR03083 family protein [Actinoplanes atraurantiacus]